jgi:hypothetical protein
MAMFLFRVDNTTAQVGDVLTVTVGLDAMGESLNALEGTFTFSSDILEPLAVRTTDSLISMWLTEPASAQVGKIPFSGITPGGFGSTLIPGADPGFLSLFTVDFRVTQEGIASFSLPDGVVLMNDGLGTPAVVYVATGNVPVVGVGDVEAYSSVEDTEPPLSFFPFVVHDVALGDGSWQLLFSTTDLETGVAYYEVQRGSGDFVRAESPYAINPWFPFSYTVRAVDDAGNAQVADAVYVPVEAFALRWGILCAIVFVLMMSGGIIWKKSLASRKK